MSTGSHERRRRSRRPLRRVTVTALTSYQGRNRTLPRQSTSAVARVAATFGVALSLLACGGAPSYGQQVNDGLGHTCDASQLVTNPAPPPVSICPASVKQPFLSVPFKGLPPILIDPYDPPTESKGSADHLFEIIRSSFTGLPLGGPVQFSLFGSDSASGVYAGVGTSSTWNSGYRVTDTAGVIAPNSLAPGFRSLDSRAGVN